MPRNKKPAVPFSPPSNNAARAKVTEVPADRRRGQVGAVKEFDLKAAHDAWKERNGIGPDELW